MKKLISFLRITIVGGVMFLAPFAVLLIILEKVHKLALGLVTPLIEQFNSQHLMGLKTPWVLATLLILMVCFTAGILAKTSAARKVMSWLETAVMSNLPGYSLMKSVGDEVAGIEPSEHYQSVLVRLDDNFLFGFLVERLSSGHVVVYIPGAPQPWEGDVMIVEESRVTLMDTPNKEVLMCLRKLGIGAGRIAAGKLG